MTNFFRHKRIELVQKHVLIVCVFVCVCVCACVCVCVCGFASPGPYALVDVEHTLCLLRKTLEGVEYIHSKGMMHRDLKVTLSLEITPTPKKTTSKVAVESQTCAFLHVHSGGGSVGNGFS